MKKATENPPTLDVEAKPGKSSDQSPSKPPKVRDLRLPLRVIAMARIGTRPNPDEARVALKKVQRFREATREHQRPDFDLDCAQSALQRLVLGYMPNRDECIVAVQSISARMLEKV